VIYEAAYFCHLLLKGNPKVIEPLYVEHRCYYIGNRPLITHPGHMNVKIFLMRAHCTTDIWRDLQRVRKALMTQQTLKHYAAYGLSQLSDLNKKKGGESKKFYHALRLLQEAENIATGIIVNNPSFSSSSFDSYLLFGSLFSFLLCVSFNSRSLFISL
jgi:predicted nucleotidyltransferase